LLDLEAGPGCPADRLRPAAPSAPAGPGRLFLPHGGWLVGLREASPTFPLDTDAQKHARPWRGPADEVLPPGPFDAAELKGDARVRSVRRVWFFSSTDTVPLPPSATGRLEQAGEVRTLLYTKRDQALADLAQVHEPIRLLVELRRSGPTA